MSAQVRPRDLQRRKFQHVAANVLDGHAGALKNHDARLSIVTTGLSELTETVNHNAKTLETLGADLAALEAITQRPFWGRLAWVLFGA